MDLVNLAGGLVSWLVQQPMVRLLAAVLSLASVLATAAANGQLADVSPEVLGQQLLEAVAAFLAAVGAWQLAHKKQDQQG